MLGAHGGHVGRAQRGLSICDGLSTRRPSAAHRAPPTQHRRARAAPQPQTRSPERAHGHLLGGHPQTWANGLRAQAALKHSINVLGPMGYVSMELICQEPRSLKELLQH